MIIKNGLILEDNQDAQVYLYEVLKASFHEVSIEIASSLEDAGRLLDWFYPDIALVDLNLPDGTGVELLHTLLQKHPHCISIVTTIYDDDNHLFSALKAGAQGYLLKEQRRDLLVDALKGITEGRPALTPKIAMKILAHFSNKDDGLTSNQENNDQILSKREKQVLAMLAKGYSTQRIAEELFISHHTVASHIKNIYAKLEISTRAEAAQKAIQFGLAK